MSGKVRCFDILSRSDLGGRVVDNLGRLDREKRQRLVRAAQMDPADWQARHRHEGEAGPAIDFTPLQEVMPGGGIGAPRARTVDTVGRLLRAKAITKPCADASRDFAEAFAAAGLEPLRAAGLTPSVQGGRADGYPGLACKRQAVWRATQALGGFGSPLAAAAWDVLGWQLTLQQFAARASFNRGCSIHVKEARALVIAAAWALAAHLGRLR